MPQEELLLMYCGLCGQVHFPLLTLPPREEEVSAVQPVQALWQDRDRLIQYLFSSSQERLPLHPQPDAHASLLLAGMLGCSQPFSCVLSALAEALTEGRYTALPPGEYCGCLVKQEHVWFFQTRASNETLFYTRDHDCLQWSTDPRQLVSAAQLDDEALAACCAGRDTFVYRGVESVGAGTVVHLTATTLHRSVFEQITPLALPRHLTLQDLATCCLDALREATYPLASARRTIGVLLSSGIDSSAIAAALVQHGARVVAYHLHVAGEASEVADAQAVCQRLGLPLVIIEASKGPDYLSEQWRFSHPYNHAGLRWFEQVAQQVSQDGVTLIATGRGGDPSFGPRKTYGLYDVLSAPIAWREKMAMLIGALSTDWCVPALIKSIGRSSSLIDESSLAPMISRHAMNTAPFLSVKAGGLTALPSFW